MVFLGLSGAQLNEGTISVGNEGCQVSIFRELERLSCSTFPEWRLEMMKRRRPRRPTFRDKLPLCVLVSLVRPLLLDFRKPGTMWARGLGLL